MEVSAQPFEREESGRGVSLPLSSHFHQMSDICVVGSWFGKWHAGSILWLGCCCYCCCCRLRCHSLSLQALLGTIQAGSPTLAIVFRLLWFNVQIFRLFHSMWRLLCHQHRDFGGSYLRWYHPDRPHQCFCILLRDAAQETEGPRQWALPSSSSWAGSISYTHSNSFLCLNR